MFRENLNKDTPSQYVSSGDQSEPLSWTLPSWVPGVAQWRRGETILAGSAWFLMAACLGAVYCQVTSPQSHWSALSQSSIVAASLGSLVVFSELFLVVAIANYLLFHGRDDVLLPLDSLGRRLVLTVCPRLGLEFRDDIHRGTADTQDTPHSRLWAWATVHYHLLPGAALCLVALKMPMMVLADSHLAQLESSSLQIIMVIYLVLIATSVFLGSRLSQVIVRRANLSGIVPITTR